MLLTTFFSPLVGAWLGAFAVPLDWDRAWQPWPISSAYAAFATYTVACALAPLVAYCADRTLNRKTA